MIKVAFLNLKPGTTKTTSAVFLAAAFHLAGLRTLLVDADKAGSAERWADLAGGFPWTTVGMARKTIARELPGLLRQASPQAVVVDTPQMEDHADIARGAMATTDVWIVPVAPAGIEVDRTATITPHMDEVDAIRATPAERLVLLTRANRRAESKSGVDFDTRQILAKNGLPVFVDQVPKVAKDDLYRASYGYVPDPAGTPYETLARYLAATGTDRELFADLYREEVARARLTKVYGAHA